MVTKPQRVLLSNNLEIRKRDLCVGELVALKPHLAGRQSSVADTGDGSRDLEAEMNSEMAYS